jgi:protein phosphatase
MMFATTVNAVALNEGEAGAFAPSRNQRLDSKHVPSPSQMVAVSSNANCTTEENQLELNVTLSIDKSSYRVGDQIQANVTVNKPSTVVMNVSSPTRNGTITFDIAQQPYVHVQSLSASIVGRWSIKVSASSLCPRPEAHKIAQREFDVVSPLSYTFTISIIGPPGVALTEGGEVISYIELQNKTLSFLEGTTHVVSVSRAIETGEGVRYYCESNRVTINSTGSWAFVYVKQYRLRITTDPRGISSDLNQDLWLPVGPDTSLPLAPDTISASDSRIRYVFVGWQIDDQRPERYPALIRADSPHVAVAQYEAQYQLIIDSQGGFGNPQGAGFYDSGSTVAFSVTSPVGILIQQVFVGWTGDYVGSSTQGSVKMDGPKVVSATWETSYNQVIILWVLGCIAVAAGYFWRKGKFPLPLLKGTTGKPIAKLLLPNWYRVGSLSDTGKIRNNNEDGTLVLETMSSYESEARSAILCAVADGVGGTAKGEVASRLTLGTVGHEVTARLLADPSQDRAVVLQTAIKAANETVVRYGEQHQESVNLASTIVAAFIDGNAAIIAHVGDSRAYLVTKDDIKQLTKDHSQVQEYVDLGKISAEEAKSYPGRNIITRAIGASSELDVDMLHNLMISQGDTILLCSDGLWDLVDNEEIKQVLHSTIDPQEACKKLVETANGRGGKDNISVIVVRSERG